MDGGSVIEVSSVFPLFFVCSRHHFNHYFLEFGLASMYIYIFSVAQIDSMILKKLNLLSILNCHVQERPFCGIYPACLSISKTNKYGMVPCHVEKFGFEHASTTQKKATPLSARGSYGVWQIMHQ